MPLLWTTSAFGLGRRRQNSPQRCYLQHLSTATGCLGKVPKSNWTKSCKNSYSKFTLSGHTSELQHPIFRSSIEHCKCATATHFYEPGWMLV